MNPDQQRALMGFNLAVAAMKVSSDVGGSKAAAEKTAASNKEQLAEMRKQGDATAKRDAERNRLLQQQADAAAKTSAESNRILQQQAGAVIKEEQKRTKLLEKQIADQKREKEREEELKRNQEKDKREAERRDAERERGRQAKQRERERERERERQARKNAEKPEAKAFAYFFTRSALQGRDELTGNGRKKLINQLLAATDVEEQFIEEFLLRPTMHQCLENETDGQKDGLIDLLKGVLGATDESLDVTVTGAAPIWLIQQQKKREKERQEREKQQEKKELNRKKDDVVKIRNKIEDEKKSVADKSGKPIEKGLCNKCGAEIVPSRKICVGCGASEREMLGKKGMLEKELQEAEQSFLEWKKEVEEEKKKRQEEDKKNWESDNKELIRREELVEYKRDYYGGGVQKAEQSVTDWKEVIKEQEESRTSSRELQQKNDEQELMRWEDKLVRKRFDIKDYEQESLKKVEKLHLEQKERLEELESNLQKAEQSVQEQEKERDKERQEQEEMRKAPLVRWLVNLEYILTDGEGIGDREQEWIGSIKRHYEISDMAVAEALTGVRKKVEERLYQQYLKQGEFKRILYLYCQMVQLDGDGCTDLERDKIIELVLKRVNNSSLPHTYGGELADDMVQKELKDTLTTCRADRLMGNTEDAAKKKIGGTIQNHIISDLEDLGTIDGAISAEQSEFLSFVNSQLKESKEFGQKARLQAVAYLLMVLGFWDLDGITDEESAKIGELLLQWDDSLNEETLPELIKKCELSYEKDTREQNTEEVIRSIGFLREKLSEAEKTQLSHHMHELAAVDGPMAEQQQAFIQWVWQELAA